MPDDPIAHVLRLLPDRPFELIVDAGKCHAIALRNAMARNRLNFRHGVTQDVGEAQAGSRTRHPDGGRCPDHQTD